MKSAYGRQVPPPDCELTCVEPGSPMGELLRRYWQPVCLSDELKDLPRKEKLLGEEIVLFRDKQGRVGALEPHCAHRGTSLEWGRIEERGLRCCYHGWLYDAQGQCLEMPCETEEFRTAMDVWQPAYPTHEYGGLVFAYMGPPGTEPLFPHYDIIDPDKGEDVVLRGMRLWGDYAVGMVKDCNWLQHWENIVDPWHLVMLHQTISGDQFQGALMQGKTRIGWEKTPLACATTSSRICRTATAWCATPSASCRTRSSFRTSASRARRRNGRSAARNCPGRCRSTTSMCAGSASSPGRSKTANPSATGSPAPTRSTRSGPARCWSAATRSASASPTISRRRKGSARSPCTRWKTWATPTPASSCCGACCASRFSAWNRVSIRSMWSATRMPTAGSRPTPGTRSCPQRKPPATPARTCRILLRPGESRDPPFNRTGSGT